MKGSKHSRQHSESATTSRRRETQARNHLVQAQAFQQRVTNPTYYPTQTAMANTGQDVYEAFQASTAMQYQQFQPQPEQPQKRSPTTGGWPMRENQYQQHQLQQHHQQQGQQQQQQHAEAKSLLDAKHRPSSGAWSMTDDHQLLTARMQGLNWNQIKDRYFPNKSSNACRKRHERLIDSKGRGTDETERMDRIATEYVGMREALWRPLAEKTGEKWTFVEKQCLANGLKNLQGMARTASRRHRFESNAMAAAAAAAAAAGYDDDSGISGICLTPGEDVGAYSSSPAPSPNTAVAQSFVSTTTQATTSAYLQQPHHHHLAHAHMNPAAAAGAYGGLLYSTAQYHHPQHAYSSSISSDGSLHPGYVSRRGNESA